jgi:hypothetical protein
MDPQVITDRDEPQDAADFRQHMVLGDSVWVRQREASDGLLALRPFDAE